MGQHGKDMGNAVTEILNLKKGKATTPDTEFAKNFCMQLGEAQLKEIRDYFLKQEQDSKNDIRCNLPLRTFRQIGKLLDCLIYHGEGRLRIGMMKRSIPVKDLGLDTLRSDLPLIFESRSGKIETMELGEYSFNNIFKALDNAREINTGSALANLELRGNVALIENTFSLLGAASNRKA
jgi:hypothetical protein